MSDTNISLQRRCDSKDVYRRTLIRPDGREVILYGYDRHTETPASDFLDACTGTSELRWHPLRREWSVYASGRQNRTFKPSKAEDPLAASAPGRPTTEIPVSDFEIVVFENRFPSFSAQALVSGLQPAGVEIASAAGRCEVLVYTTAGEGSLATLTDARRRLLVHTWMDRYRELFSAGAAYVLPFENRGEEVGVTLSHPHGQVYAFPVVPKVQSEAAQAFAEGYDLAKQLAAWQADYGIADIDGVVSFAPPFARFPYEIWLAPKQRRAGPWDMSDEEINGFAQLLGDTTRRYDAFFKRDCPYMLSLHAAPAGEHDNWHFTAQFYPLLRSPEKLKYLASVEQATGLFTVDIAPEETAREFRAL